MQPAIDIKEPLEVLYNLILNPEVTQEERDLLVNAKNKIEHGDDVLPVFNLLLGYLRPYAIKRIMSKPVAEELYLKAMTRPSNDQKFWSLVYLGFLASGK